MIQSVRTPTLITKRPIIKQPPHISNCYSLRRKCMAIGMTQKMFDHLLIISNRLHRMFLLFLAQGLRTIHQDQIKRKRWAIRRSRRRKEIRLSKNNYKNQWLKSTIKPLNKLEIAEYQNLYIMIISIIAMSLLVIWATYSREPPTIKKKGIWVKTNIIIQNLIIKVMEFSWKSFKSRILMDS